jgi:hypothetical protein
LTVNNLSISDNVPSIAPEFDIPRSKIKTKQHKPRSILIFYAKARIFSTAGALRRISRNFAPKFETCSDQMARKPKFFNIRVKNIARIDSYAITILYFQRKKVEEVGHFIWRFLNDRQGARFASFLCG